MGKVASTPIGEPCPLTGISVVAAASPLDSTFMLDAPIRRHIDPVLDCAGRWLAARGATADGLTVVGFLVGLGAVAALGYGQFQLALALILLNRLADGLDGAVARYSRITDFGGYIDIVCDFLVYAAVPFGFALADPAGNAMAALFLVLAFVGTSTSFLAFAIMAEKHGIRTNARGAKSFYYLGGLIEGSETMAVFVAMCLWPHAFVWLAYGFGALCWLTTASRVAAARGAFRH